MYLILFQIGEVETVRDVELARCCVNRIEADILMHVFHFCHCRMRTTVGVDKTVAKEITVAGCIYSEVTSVSPVFSSVLVFLEQTLIYPVPDISSLKVRIFIDSLPLSPEISGRVAHCVCIF